MRASFILAVLLFGSATLGAAALPYFSVLSDDAGAWPDILGSIGLERQPASLAHIFVARAGAPASTEWTARVDQGAILILEGESSLAEMFGFKRGKDSVRVSSLEDIHSPKLPIVWEKSLELPVFTIPGNAQVFARERWNGAPLSAGVRRGGPSGGPSGGPVGGAGPSDLPVSSIAAAEPAATGSVKTHWT